MGLERASGATRMVRLAGHWSMKESPSHTSAISPGSMNWMVLLSVL